jgi:predicted Zn-dependent protease
MIGRERALGLLNESIRSRPEEQIELLLIARESGCSRYANSVIHQNVHEDGTTLYVRVLDAGKLGIVKLSSLDGEDIRRGIDRARAAGRLGSAETGFDMFPSSQSYREVSAFFEATVACDHRKRAEWLGMIFEEGNERGVEFAGAFTTGKEEVAVVNSNGLEAYQLSSVYEVTFTALTGRTSGFSGRFGTDIDSIDPRSLARDSMDKALGGGDAVSLEPGRYTVILEPKALAELLEWTSYIAFGAKSFQDETSFMAGRIGEQILGEDVTIYDDGLDPAGFPHAFDYEGVPKSRTDIIRRGRAVGVMYDSLYGRREGKDTTGNAVVPDAEDGPLPMNLFVEGGDQSRPEIIASTDRAVYITRFHYVNGLLEPERAVMTGMTRDGTFLVEEGKITRRVEDMRFTDSVLRMLNNVSAISNDREAIKSWWSDEGVHVVPAIRVEGFQFTGKTK